jgi:hypothetical protein
MTGITENAFINIKGRSSAVTAEIEVPKGGANGVIIAQAGRFGGWSLYMKGGRVHEVYNFGGWSESRPTKESTSGWTTRRRTTSRARPDSPGAFSS